MKHLHLHSVATLQPRPYNLTTDYLVSPSTQAFNPGKDLRIMTTQPNKTFPDERLVLVVLVDIIQQHP